MSASDRRAIVVGAGHNGLVAGCYLAREGWDVVVVERQARAGGATSTEERLPGHRFDLDSVAHNMINMTDIIQDLALEECGLEYLEMDPFSTMFTPAGQAVRFYRDLERTCDEIARVDPAEARRYRGFIRTYDPLILASTSMFRRNGRRDLLRALPGVARWWRRAGAWGAMGELFSSYGRLLDSCCETQWMKAGLAALAAHATVGPDMPGGAYYVMWQAAYHRYGMWHARGGSGALAEALQRRLQSYGGKVITNAEVVSLEVQGSAVAGLRVKFSSGGSDVVEAPVVITTVNPKTVLTEWLPEQALSRELRRHVSAARTANVVQFIIHIAASQLPRYRGTEGMHDAWNGMAAMSHSLDQISLGFRQSELGLIPDDPGVYIFTPSAIDQTLCASGSHTVYLACPTFPGRLAPGCWAEEGLRAAERLVAQVEAYAPGFKRSITAMRPYTPAEMEKAVGLLNGHPMHLSLDQSQLLLMRPVPALGSHRTPIRGLYLSGAGTAPSGGVLGIPGRRAAQAVLRDARA